jgi:hypothetical protein
LSRFRLSRPPARDPRRRLPPCCPRKASFDHRCQPHPPSLRRSTSSRLSLDHRYWPHLLGQKRSTLFLLRMGLKLGPCWLFRRYCHRCRSSCHPRRLRSTRFLRFPSCPEVCHPQIHPGSRRWPCCCRQGPARTRTQSRLVSCSWAVGVLVSVTDLRVVFMPQHLDLAQTEHLPSIG